MEPQQNFFQRKAASEAAICEIVKMLVEDFGANVTITVSVEPHEAGLGFSKQPKITTIIK